MESGTREKARNVLKRILAAASYDVEEVGDPLDLSVIGSEDAWWFSARTIRRRLGVSIR